MAARTTAVNALGSDSCNVAGGECSKSKCCDGLTCLDLGLAGKKCVDADEKLQCVPNLATCGASAPNASTPCCDKTAVCEEYSGQHVCRAKPVCSKEMDRCTSTSDCCGDDMTCIPALDGNSNSKQCRKLPTVSSSLSFLSIGKDSALTLSFS